MARSSASPPSPRTRSGYSRCLIHGRDLPAIPGPRLVAESSRSLGPVPFYHLPRRISRIVSSRRAEDRDMRTTAGTVPGTVPAVINSGTCRWTISAMLCQIPTVSAGGIWESTRVPVPAVTGYSTCRTSRTMARRLICTAARRGTRGRSAEGILMALCRSSSQAAVPKSPTSGVSAEDLLSRVKGPNHQLHRIADTGSSLSTSSDDTFSTSVKPT